MTGNRGVRGRLGLFLFGMALKQEYNPQAAFRVITCIFRIEV